MFTGLAEGDVGPLLHDESEAPFACGQIGQVAVGVQGEVRLASLFEFPESFLVVARNPAGRGVFDRLVGGVHAVFVLQAGHRHVELEDADRPQDVIIAHQRPEDLDRPFFRELGESLLELFDLERVLDPYPPEVLRGEVGDSGELEGLPFRKGVAGLDRPVVVNPDDVARVRLLDVGPVLGQPMHLNIGLLV